MKLDPSTRMASSPPTVLLPDNAFVGRREELSALVRLHDGGARLVTLTGIGGAGKTRLALEFARQLSTPVVVVDATDARTAEDLVLSVAAELAGRCSEETTAGVGAALATLDETLLVVDAVEGSAAGGSDVLAEWLRAAPDVRFLVTSRIPLGVAAEQVVLLGPLSIEEGLQLLVARARALDFRFDPEHELDDLREVLECLEGIPLAIELAAAPADDVGAPDPGPARRAPSSPAEQSARCRPSARGHGSCAGLVLDVAEPPRAPHAQGPSGLPTWVRDRGGRGGDASPRRVGSGVPPARGAGAARAAQGGHPAAGDEAPS
ncbi:MAG: AAA family ATPase [Myxococcales bacterium]|nr:AAA family ATPase [Myxococcales bacterium]